MEYKSIFDYYFKEINYFKASSALKKVKELSPKDVLDSLKEELKKGDPEDITLKMLMVLTKTLYAIETFDKDSLTEIYRGMNNVLDDSSQYKKTDDKHLIETYGALKAVQLITFGLTTDLPTYEQIEIASRKYAKDILEFLHQTDEACTSKIVYGLTGGKSRTRIKKLLEEMEEKGIVSSRKVGRRKDYMLTVDGRKLRKYIQESDIF